MNRKLGASMLAVAVSIGLGVFSACKSGTSHASNRLGALKPEPNVTFKDLGGSKVSLASFEGKVVLVNFWATWCDPCRAEIPELIEFQQKNASKGFTVLGIAMDDDGAKVVQPFVQKVTFDVSGHPTLMNYPIVIGNDDIADRFGGLIGFPTSVLITRDGKIAKKFVGAVTEDDLKMIESLVGS